MLRNIKGLKYPDEYFIKFFFKFKLHENTNNTYLELGCSNGCNLTLPYEFNNHVIGVDLDNTLINYANENFNLFNTSNNYQFYNQDMIKFCQENNSINSNVLVLASSIYYIPKNDFITLLKNIKKNKLIDENIPFFIRFRNTDDFRNNKGKDVGHNSIIINNNITGEDGVFCKFYEIDEMIDILQKELNLRNFEVLKLKYDNIQKNTLVTNSEVVIWGYIN